MNSSKLRLIQCGISGHGGSWLKNTSSQSPDFDLVALVDIVPNALEKARTEIDFSGPTFTSLEDALQNVAADAVLTVTPPTVHLPHAKLAFAHGLHLMTEKPFADSLENAQEMRRLAHEANCQLVVSQNYRYSRGVQMLKTLLEQHTVGELGHGDLDFYIPADFTGSFRETMEFPLLLDMAIHHLDLIRAVTGRNIARITAQSFNPDWSWYQHDAGLKMLMELDDGTPFSYSGDWSARGRSTSWNGDWRLQCSEGALHFVDDEVQISRSERWSKNAECEEVAALPLEFEGLNATLHEFARAIRSGVPAPIAGDDNIHSLAAVFAAMQSAREGRSVEVMV